jgi:hypothetical protein
MHKIPFTTVIITTQKPSVTHYQNPSLAFTPKIINLKDRDADKVLQKIEIKLAAGGCGIINELELIYLPLYGSASGKNTADLLDAAIKLTPKVAKDDKHKKKKLQDLLLLLTGSFISDEELNKVMEVNMRVLDDSPAVRVLEKRGREKERIEIAKAMIKRGMDFSDIAELTGLEMEKIIKLEDEPQLATA